MNISASGTAICARKYSSNSIAAAALGHGLASYFEIYAKLMRKLCILVCPETTSAKSARELPYPSVNIGNSHTIQDSSHFLRQKRHMQERGGRVKSQQN